LEITTDRVRQLREETGAGVMDCKRALTEAAGDMEKAKDILKQQGLDRAEKKAGRLAAQGLVESYIHAGGRIGVLVELNCESDFVARTDDFRALAHDLAMQIAALAPRYVRQEDVPAGVEVEPNEVLLNQPFIRDAGVTVQDLIRSSVAKLGENIQVRRFVRFALGEGAAE
jgi:elongation factor Ts